VNSDPRTLVVGESLTCRIALGGQVISFDTVVRYVDTQGLFIERPTGIEERLEVGSELLIRYVRPDSAYQFLTVILPQETSEGDEDSDPDEPMDYRHLPVKLRFPSRITRYQRRAYDRSQVEGIVKYRSANKDIRTYRGYILDLSAGGVRFATRQVGFLEEGRNPVGMHISISLLLSKGHEFNEIASEIRRVTLDKEHVQDDYLIVQAAFRELDPKQQDKLDMWVKRHRRVR
jgi:PilZ domain